MLHQTMKFHYHRQDYQCYMQTFLSKRKSYYQNQLSQQHHNQDLNNEFATPSSVNMMGYAV